MATATAQIHFRTSSKAKALPSMAAEFSDLSQQQTLVLKKRDWLEFARRLDTPARDLPRLRKLLIEPAVFVRSATRA